MEHAKLKRFSQLYRPICRTGASFVSGMMPSMGQQTLIVAGKLGPEPEILNMYKLLMRKIRSWKSKWNRTSGDKLPIWSLEKWGHRHLPQNSQERLRRACWSQRRKCRMIQKKCTKWPRGYLETRQLAFLKPMDYQNTYAVAVPRAIAENTDSRRFLTWRKSEGQLKAGFTLGSTTEKTEIVVFKKYTDWT